MLAPRWNHCTDVLCRPRLHSMSHGHEDGTLTYQQRQFIQDVRTVLAWEKGAVTYSQVLSSYLIDIITSILAAVVKIRNVML